MYPILLFLSSLLKTYGHCGHIRVFAREFMVFQCPLAFSGVDRVDTFFHDLHKLQSKDLVRNAVQILRSEA
jgi:hypothetical protein